MSITFLETELYIDASKFTIGTGGTSITLKLTLDARSSAPGTFSFTIYDTDGSTPLNANFPFTINSLVQDSNGAPETWLLTITFDQAFDDINFNFRRKITLTEATNNSTFDIYVIADYANAYTLAGWDNTDTEIANFTDIDVHAGLISTQMNNRLKALLRTALAAWDSASLSLKYYYYKNKYLNDIIDVATGLGVLPENATSVVSTNSDGSIATIEITYPDRSFGNKILLSYIYSGSNEYTVDRMQMRNGSLNPTPLATSAIVLLESISIDSVDNSGNVIYNLGQLILTRSINTLTIPFLSDYNSSLASDSTDTSALAANMLADFKYYQTSTITGWTVIA